MLWKSTEWIFPSVRFSSAAACAHERGDGRQYAVGSPSTLGMHRYSWCLLRNPMTSGLTLLSCAHSRHVSNECVRRNTLHLFVSAMLIGCENAPSSGRLPVAMMA